MANKGNDTEDPKALSGQEDEAALMRAIAEGDKAAFERVVDMYMAQIYRFCYRMLGDGTRAEDATQDCFVRLWNSAGSWKPSGRIRSWLLRIAHNLCIDELRSLKSHEPIEDHTYHLAVAQPSPQQALQRLEASREIHLALAALPERQRTALMLIHYSECSHIEAAEIMGVSIEAIESLLARGKRGLREILGTEGKTILKEGTYNE